MDYQSIAYLLWLLTTFNVQIILKKNRYKINIEFKNNKTI